MDAVCVQSRPQRGQQGALSSFQWIYKPGDEIQKTPAQQSCLLYTPVTILFWRLTLNSTQLVNLYWRLNTNQQPETKGFYGVPPSLNYNPPSLVFGTVHRKNIESQETASMPTCGHHCIYYLHHQPVACLFNRLYHCMIKDVINKTNNNKVTAMMTRFHWFHDNSKFCHHGVCSIETFMWK